LASSFLIHEVQHLQTDQLDTRLKAVGLVGDLFALPGSAITETFQSIFSEFLKRLTDRVVAVRMCVLECVKSCLLSNPFRAEAAQIICKSVEWLY
jgi:sister-chromatid-cohesion protein PDS5